MARRRRLALVTRGLLVGEMLARELVQPAMYTCLIQPSDCLISQAEADQLTKIYLAVAAPQSQNIIEFKSAAQKRGDV